MEYYVDVLGLTYKKVLLLLLKQTELEEKKTCQYIIFIDKHFSFS